MNNCNYCRQGNSLHNGQCPATYNGMFQINPAPYDSLTWLVTWNGFTSKVRIPANSETDTKLSTDQSNATLNYKAEAHKDTITGAQLGELVKLDDLRNVDFDTSLTGTCYELVYRKYGSCGEGCTSIQNKWYNFNINSDSAKKSYLQYVRGTNAYGCPEYLDVPTTTSQYWFAGWKTDGENKQFGYFQPTSGTIPEDTDGNPLVLSINQTTKAPIVGPIKIDPWGDAVCSTFTPASGLVIAEGGGNSICYYPRIGMASMSLDLWVSSARTEAHDLDTVIATIADSRLWPTYIIDLPAHVIWDNNSNGDVSPIRLRFNTLGQLLLSGHVPARTASGKARYIVDGIDDVILWSPQGV